MADILGSISSEVGTATSQISSLFSGSGMGTSFLAGGADSAVMVVAGLFLFRYIAPLIFPLLSTVSYALSSLVGSVCFVIRMTIGLVSEYFNLATFYLFRLASKRSAVQFVLIGSVLIAGILIGSRSFIPALTKPAKTSGTLVEDSNNIIGRF